MRFRIASERYSVRITEGPIVCEGIACEGACLQAGHEILIAADCRPNDRPHVLYRELMRGWIFETGEPKDVPAWLELSASMIRATTIDMNAQGGELALVGLRAGESPETSAAKIGLTRSRQCAVCRGDVAGGSVVCVPAKTPGVVDLALHCEFCNHTQRWQEAQSARGLPSGQVVGEPVFERGDTIGTREMAE